MGKKHTDILQNIFFCVPQKKESPLGLVVMLGWHVYTLKETQISHWHFQTVKQTSSYHSCNSSCFTEKLAGYQKCNLYRQSAQKHTCTLTQTHTAALWPTAALKSHRCFGVFIMHHGRKHLVMKYVPPKRYEGRAEIEKVERKLKDVFV